MKIQFDSICINSIWANSGTFTGDNLQVNWTTQYKENSALGQVAGDYNMIVQNINIVYDNDLVDAPFTTGNTSAGEGKKGE